METRSLIYHNLSVCGSNHDTVVERTIWFDEFLQQLALRVCIIFSDVPRETFIWNSKDGGHFVYWAACEFASQAVRLRRGHPNHSVGQERHIFQSCEPSLFYLLDICACAKQHRHKYTCSAQTTPDEESHLQSSVTVRTFELQAPTSNLWP